jgi:hypothetical protein
MLVLVCLQVQSAAVHTEKLILFYHHCTIIKKGGGVDAYRGGGTAA